MHEMTTTDYIPHWSPEQRGGFRKQTVFGRHSLMDRPETAAYFTDDALAELLDRHPIEDLDIATMDFDSENAPESWAEVARAGRKGDEIIEAVKKGRLWINVRNVHKHHAHFFAIVEGFFGDLATHNPGFRPRGIYGGLLISSPGARVFYHADTSEMSLWQFRGHKRFYIYPNVEPYLDLDHYEGVVLKEGREEFNWRPEFDEACEMKVLAPGDFATWAMAAPHKVFNEDEMNVSLTTEFTTWRTRALLGAVYANGFMRRHMKLPLPPQKIAMPAQEMYLKFALSVPIQTLRLNRKNVKRHYEIHELDPAAAHGFVPLPEPRLRTT
jgi:hypothetical protein